MDIGDDTGCPGACRDARDPMPPLASQTRCVYDYGDTPGGREQLLPKPLACAVGDDGWLLHDHARLHRRSHRESDHHGPATHRLRHRGLGDQRLSAGLRGANAGGRPAWRPVRPEESLPDWPGGIHRCVAGVRSVERCRHADCRSSGARRRRRIAYPADAVDDNADLPRLIAAVSRWAHGAPSPVSPAWWDRWPAARWSTAWGGSGFSSSTFPSASSA